MKKRDLLAQIEGKKKLGKKLTWLKKYLTEKIPSLPPETNIRFKDFYLWLPPSSQPAILFGMHWKPTKKINLFFYDWAHEESQLELLPANAQQQILANLSLTDRNSIGSASKKMASVRNDYENSLSRELTKRDVIHHVTENTSGDNELIRQLKDFLNLKHYSNLDLDTELSFSEFYDTLRKEAKNTILNFLSDKKNRNDQNYQFFTRWKNKNYYNTMPEEIKFEALKFLGEKELLLFSQTSKDNYKTTKSYQITRISSMLKELNATPEIIDLFSNILKIKNKGVLNQLLNNLMHNLALIRQINPVLSSLTTIEKTTDTLKNISPIAITQKWQLFCLTNNARMMDAYIDFTNSKPDSAGRTLAHFMGLSNDIQNFSAFGSRVDMSAKDNTGATLIHYLALNPDINYKMVDYVNLLQKKFKYKNINLQATDNDGRNVLHYAVMSGNQKTVSYLLKQFPSLKSESDQQKNTLLHYAARFATPEMMNYLKENEINPLAKNAKSETILHFAIQGGRKENILAAVALGCKDFNETPSGKSIFDYANDNAEIIELLRNLSGKMESEPTPRPH